MTNYQREELENIRRTAERGKALAEWKAEDMPCAGLIDPFIHILDIVERIKNDNKAQDPTAGY